MTGSSFLPHEPTPEDREKANQVLDALFKADDLGRRHGLLTGGELAVVEALRMRLRARVRQSTFRDEGAYEEMTERLLSAARAVAEEPLS